MKLVYIALALVLALGAGFGTGWHAKGVSVRAASAKAAQAETKAVVADVNKQSAEQHKTATAEQGKSQALAIDQSTIRIKDANLRQAIDHAVFIPYALPAGTCPDVTASAEFVRIYDSAAGGSSDTPAAASSR